ncbi:MAG TPA: hypothetical protein DCS05_02455 [Nitrospiraceae bacterium]|nr:hypothetical protein [Nitrospiraceae bacterium]
MWSIIGGMILQAIGGGVLYGASRAHETGAGVVLTMVGIVAIIWGFGVVLNGLKYFFLEEILSELKKLNAQSRP